MEQKGSYVAPSYFRFDFSHFEKMTDEQIEKVEKRVNELIRLNSPLEENRYATIDQAKEMGAMALFGEKYGDRVRIVKFGDSVELCGGTHAAATGQIGFFKIVSESAIAAGIRRIEATTGEDAENVVDAMESMLRSAKALFNNAPDLALSIRKLIEENDHFKKEMEAVIKEKTIALKNTLISNSREINGVKVISFSSPIDPSVLKNAALLLQKETTDMVVAGAFEYQGKPQLLLMYSPDLVEAGHNAAKDIREAAKAILGGGGGQPGLATAGGKNTDGLQEALNTMIELATR